MRPPNLLFIFTDEQRFDTLAATGAGKVQMPNVNRLAEQSCLFEEAYCTQPVCTPSRESHDRTLSSRHRCREQQHAASWRRFLSFPDVVRRASGTLCHRLSRKVAPRRRGLFSARFRRMAEHRRLFLSRVLPPRTRSRNPFTYSQWFHAQGFKPDLENTFTRERIATLPEPFGKAAYMANEANRFIRENRQRHSFCMSTSSSRTCRSSARGPKSYDPAAVPLPPNFDHVPSETDVA